MRKLLFISVLLITFISSFCFAAKKSDYITTPKTNNGEKWHLGYYHGGAYIDYQRFFKATIIELVKLGWIENLQMPESFKEGEDTKKMWEWLAKNAKSEYLEFVADAHWSSEWEDDIRLKVKEKMTNRLKSKKDIDFMFALGTWGGIDLSSNKHSTPTLVISATDAVGAGIIKSAEDSGFDHINAQVDPKFHERQVRLFHDIFKFKTLGLAYENTETGRSTIAFDAVAKVAKERNFKIASCYALDKEIEKAKKDLLKCYKELAPKIDALYFTPHNGAPPKSISALMKPMNKYNVPTFSLVGSLEVKLGVLMSIAQAGPNDYGEFHAKTIATILNGVKPRNLEQIFEAPPKISINLQSAKLIGYDPPIDILGASDEIFKKIFSPPEN